MAGGRMNKSTVLLICVCAVLTIFDGYDTAIMGQCLTSIKADLTIDSVTAGYLGSSSLLGMFFGAIICGVLSDKIGRKKVMIVSLLIFAVFTGLSATSRDVSFFLFTRLLTGVGLGGIYPAAFATASEYAPVGRKAMTVVLVGIGMEIGKILAALVSIAVIPTLGWRVVFAICLLPLIVIPLIVKEMPETMHIYFKKENYEEAKRVLHAINPEYVPEASDTLIETSGSMSTGSFFELFKQGRARNTVCFIILYSSVVFIGYAVLTWLPDLMVSAGYSMTEGHLSQLFVNTGTLIASLLFGVIADRFGFRHAAMAIFAIGTISVLGLSLASGLVATMSILVLVGACACDQNLNHAYISASYPTEIRGTMIGWGLGLARLPGMAAPILLGYLSQTNMPLSTIFLILAAVPLISFLAVTLSHDNASKTNRKESAQN
jgi:AAHS family benzoate transporter-like MFS transporter